LLRIVTVKDDSKATQAPTAAMSATMALGTSAGLEQSSSRPHQPTAPRQMTTATADYATWDVHAYSNLLEECTGYQVTQSTDRDGELCYQLIDPYGDAIGEPWYQWADVVFDTEDAVEAHLQTINGD